MTLIDPGPIPAEPVPLADLKRWCRIDRDDEDALIEALARAAREAIEAETRTILVRRAFRLVVDVVPPDRRIALPRQPVVAVTQVVAFDAQGDPHGFGAADVAIEREADSTAVQVGAAIQASAANGLEIEFTAGYATGEVPEALTMAIRRIVSASYELRGALTPAQQPGFIPQAARELMAPFRRVSI